MLGGARLRDGWWLTLAGVATHDAGRDATNASVGLGVMHAVVSVVHAACCRHKRTHPFKGEKKNSLTAYIYMRIVGIVNNSQKVQLQF